MRHVSNHVGRGIVAAVVLALIGVFTLGDHEVKDPVVQAQGAKVVESVLSTGELLAPGVSKA